MKPKMDKGVIGVRLETENIGSTASWSKMRFSWVLIIRNYNITEKCDVVLEASMLSRRKLITVNGLAVYDGTWSLPNFNHEFEVGEGHKAKILQERDTYELYVDGKAFPQIYDSSYSYEPPQVRVEHIEPIPQKIVKPAGKVSEAVREASKPMIEEMMKNNPGQVGPAIYQKKQQQSVFDQMKELKRKELQILMQAKKKEMMKRAE